MTVTNGLYTIEIEMTDGGHGRATGVIVLTTASSPAATCIFITPAPTPPTAASGAAN